MILLRSRIITAAFNLLLANVVQLSHEWNSTLLQITTVVLPKWQIRAQHIVDTAILQRQRLRQQDVKSSSSSNNTRTSPADTQTKDAPQTGVVKPAVIEEETDDLQENLVPDVSKDAETELILETSRLTSEEQVVRQRLTIALTACVAFLALQIFLGVILLCTSVNGLPLGLVFQVACLAYIAYLLQSVSDHRRNHYQARGCLLTFGPFLPSQICDFTRLNVTNCNYGKASKVSRKVFNNTAVVAEASDGAVKVIQLSFEDNE